MASFVFLLFLLFLQSAAASEVISVKPGDNVILTCRADGGSITAVEWTRTDLKSGYVFIYTDGRSDPTNQHPSFEGRVQLVDSDLKGGDVSLILKNVNMNDRGTYKCRVATEGSGPDMKTTRSFRLEATEVKSAKPGDDVILTCRADDGFIRDVEWTRTKPSPAVDIVIYRDGQSVSQHFHDRVELDSDLKKGDVSLILKNVNKSDRGTYECRVATGSSGRRKRAISNPEPIRRFRLEVTDSGGDDEHVGWIAAAVVAGVVGVVGALVVWRCKRRREQSSNPPAVDEAVKVDLL